MSFLTLNGTAIPCRSNACDVKHDRHRKDMQRMFSGEMRLTSGAIYRTFTIVTAFQNETDYETVKALVESNDLPLIASGDLVKNGPIYVMPDAESWTPVQTADGFRRQAKFTLFESSLISAPDTSAVPWLFCRAGTNMLVEAGTFTPGSEAANGDRIYEWQDALGSGRRLRAPYDISNHTPSQFRPTRDGDGARFLMTAQAVSGDGGMTSSYPSCLVFLDESDDRTPFDAFDALEIMVRIRADDSPPATNTTNCIWWLMQSGHGNLPSLYPATDGTIQEALGDNARSSSSSIVVDLTGNNCYDAFNDLVTKGAYLNGTSILTHTLTGSFGLDTNDPAQLGSTDSSSRFDGVFEDVVVFAAKLNTAQRTAWTNYLRRLTSRPPI